MTRTSTFLLTVALIAGMVGCAGSGGGDGGESYTLTVDSATGGMVAVSNVTIAGQMIFTYAAVPGSRASGPPALQLARPFRALHLPDMQISNHLVHI